MPKATAAETSGRIEQLQEMILKGEPNTACLAYARQTWGLSRAQGYKLIKRAWQQIKLDIDESGIDRRVVVVTRRYDRPGAGPWHLTLRVQTEAAFGNSLIF